MSDGFQVLLDAPGEARKRIQIARLGPVVDKRWGEFEITKDNVSNWQRNLEHLPGQRALIDFEHRSERAPRDSKAAGWITNIDLDGDKVMADAEWTPDGEQAIRDKSYLFLSPAYGKFEAEDGTVYDDTLQSTALTNKPKLGSLPMLTLASEERMSEALDEDPASAFYMRALDGDLGDQTRALVLLDVSQAERDQAVKEGNALPDGSYPIRNVRQLKAAATLAASGHGNVKAAKALIRRRAKALGIDVMTLPGLGGESKSDIRPSMLDTEVLKALDLDTDADDTKVLEAIAALKQKADAEPEPKTLEQQAADDGKVLLDAERLTTLMADAKAGADAKRELHEQRFETAFTRALENQDGAKVTPAEKEDLHALYQLDSDRVLKMIDEREPIVQAKPSGDPAIQLDADTDPDTLRAHGIHPDNHQLHQEVLKRLKDAGKPMTEYPKMLEQVIGAEA